MVLAVLVSMGAGLLGNPASAQVSGASYTSPRHGYTIAWQSPWYIVNTDDSGSFDTVAIADSDSFVYFAGSADGEIPQSAVDGFHAYMQDDPSYANIAALGSCVTVTGPYPSTADCYRYDHTYDSGAVVAEGVLIQAWDLGSGIVLLMVASVDETLFDSYLPKWAQFVIAAPGQDAALDASGGQSEEILNGVTFLFDPLVSAEDRFDVIEGVRLGQDAIARYLGESDLGDVRITVLDTAYPQDAYLMAATLGSSIVVYAGGDSWRAAPSIVRIETMVHELTHVYHGKLLGDRRDEPPIWFIEGTAEAMGFQAVSQLGVIDQNDVYDLELYWLTSYPVDGSLGDLQGSETMSVDNYPLAYIAVQYLLGRSGLSVSAIGDAFAAMEQGASFDDAFTSAFGISPDQFYPEFDAWRLDLKRVFAIPDDFSPPAGSSQVAAASWIHEPAPTAAGDQLIMVVSTLPEANCSASVSAGGETIERATFANDEGEAFWLVTIPDGTPVGMGSATVTCGSTPIEAGFSVTPG